MDNFTTENLLLYSQFTDNPIGTAIAEPVNAVAESPTYYEFAHFVTFQIDYTEDTKIMFVRWRIPKDNECWWQFTRILNNNTGLASVEFVHINSELLPTIHSVRLARIGGSIQDGVLQEAASPLNVTVTKTENKKEYQLLVNNGEFEFLFNPDSLSTGNADEIDFETE
ncbi:MAG: hypothetical protein LBF88_07120 [Planctomycetaceae bacterium]|jgi:hypothetical protein|nr:hypothetical protein [Planctomycetaceae bacterium]